MGVTISKLNQPTQNGAGTTVLCSTSSSPKVNIEYDYNKRSKGPLYLCPLPT
jgi:hypothetical protein